MAGPSGAVARCGITERRPLQSVRAGGPLDGRVRTVSWPGASGLPSIGTHRPGGSCGLVPMPFKERSGQAGRSRLARVLALCRAYCFSSARMACGSWLACAMAAMEACCNTCALVRSAASAATLASRICDWAEEKLVICDCARLMA